jgi:protein FAM32A
MPEFKRGKLKLKGSKSASKSTKKKTKHEISGDSPSSTHHPASEQVDTQKYDPEAYMTKSQLAFKKKQDERLLNEGVRKLASETYRERLEKFNYSLATATEHNDIPRVSAAGNG